MLLVSHFLDLCSKLYLQSVITPQMEYYDEDNLNTGKRKKKNLLSKKSTQNKASQSLYKMCFHIPGLMQYFHTEIKVHSHTLILPSCAPDANI